MKMAENKTCESAASCSKESCEGCPSSQGPESFLADLNPYSSVKKVIAVVSGKGGVGKSFVTSSLANEMAKKGYADRPVYPEDVWCAWAGKGK